MAINSQDIKLLESQRLIDTDDGGGRATGKVIASGAVNAIFPPVDRIDQAFGEFSARKVFGGPQTDSTEMYHGSHSALIQDAVDPNINLLMVDTKSDADTLRDLKNFVESYQVKSSQTLSQLWGDHLQHQQTVVLFQPVDEAVPAPSDVLFLVEGKTEQPVRVRRVETEVREIPARVGDQVVQVMLRRVALDLFNRLEYGFSGSQPTAGFEHRGTQIYTSRPSTGVKYYGVKRLAKAVKQGVGVINVGDPFLPLAPASRRTESLTNLSPFNAQQMRITVGNRNEEIRLHLSRRGESTSYVGYLPYLLDSEATMRTDSTSFKDRGDGTFQPISGAGYEWLMVDLNTRRVELRVSQGYNLPSSKTVLFSGKAAVVVTGQTVNSALVIDAANQRNSYQFNLSQHPPKPETIELLYRALGKTCRLKGLGSGELIGDGTGTLDPINGMLQANLSALPDIDSTIVLTWASQRGINLQYRHDIPLRADARFQFVMEQPAEVGSVRVKWLHNDQEVIASDNGRGQLELDGQAVGVLAYANADGVAELALTPVDRLPMPGSQINVSYRKVTTVSQIVEVDGLADISFTLDYPVAPGSLSFDVITNQYHDVSANGEVYPEQEKQRTRHWSDNGAGEMQAKGGLSGTVNYVSRQVQIYPSAPYKQLKFTRTVTSVTPSAPSSSGAWTPPGIGNVVVPYSARSGGSLNLQDFMHPTPLPPATKRKLNREIVTIEPFYVPATELLPAQTLMVHYQKQDVLGSACSESFAVGHLKLTLDEFQAQPVIPGSVRIQTKDQLIVDINGSLVANPHPATGAGTQVGTIDYDNHVALLAEWAGPDFTLIHMATMAAGCAIDKLMFTTASAPVARNGLHINATTLDGKRLVGQVAANGELTGDFRGELEANSGLVLAYAPDPEDETRQLYIMPETVTYSCVIEQLVPLDKHVIKIDPIRLPPDGRVPVYREGDLLLLSHTARKEIGVPVAGQALNAERSYLAHLDLVDTQGKSLKQTMRKVELKTGELKLATPLDLVDVNGNQLNPPLTLVHRVEHMTPVVDVRLNGDIVLMNAPYHDYPVNETVVCSCPIHGDRWARVHSLFTQKNWNSNDPVWRNERTGADTSAKYNELTYPFEITNKGAVNERWALVFTSTNTFEIVGETMGVIGTGNTATDCAPMNPNTNTPYFVIRADGWGSGWQINNVLRFNTDSSLNPVWLIRVTQPGKLQVDKDHFIYQMRGDVV